MNSPIRAMAAAAALALAPSLQGCTGAAIGAGAVTTTAAMEERGLGGAIDDNIIRARINALWLDHSEEMLRKVGLSISEGRALLTGVVPNEQMRTDAVRLAWQAEGVKEVINEIEVSEGGGMIDYARDVWISNRLRAELTFDRDVMSINYSVDTVNGTVYLLGIAQDEAELRRVQNHARNLSYVKRVVSYVRLKDDPRRKSGGP